MVDLVCIFCNNKITKRVKYCPHCKKPVSVTLADYYYYGNEIERDYNKAFQLYKMALEDKDEYAYYSVAHCYYYGVGTEINYEEAYKYASLAYNVGNIQSCEILSLCKLYGKGTQKDEEGAVEIMDKGAKNNNIICIYNLACFYINNEYKNLSKEERNRYAINLFKQGAGLGDSDCMYSLGDIFEEGELIEQSMKRAISWYEEAANNGLIKAAEHLAKIYEEGDLVEKNTELAEKYYGKCVELGDSNYKLKIAEIEIKRYKNGEVVDMLKVISNLEQMSKDNIEGAEYRLGSIYEEGYGVPINREIARKWYQLGKDRNDVLCDIALSILEF